MYQIFALTGLKNYAFSPYSDVFYPTWHPSGCFFILASRPHLLELCGQMANLVAETGSIKGQLSNLVEAICHLFRKHDAEELKKLVEWQRRGGWSPVARR